MVERIQPTQRIQVSKYGDQEKQSLFLAVIQQPLTAFHTSVILLWQLLATFDML
jgi:hypothetical protein